MSVEGFEPYTIQFVDWWMVPLLISCNLVLKFGTISGFKYTELDGPEGPGKISWRHCVPTRIDCIL